jgi:hypothetical protein
MRIKIRRNITKPESIYVAAGSTLLTIAVLMIYIVLWAVIYDDINGVRSTLRGKRLGRQVM